LNVLLTADVVPLSELKVNPGRIVRQVTETHRPVLLTSRGRGVAVVQALSDYEAANEDRAYMRSVIAGVVDVDAGLAVDIDEVKRRLGLSWRGGQAPRQLRSFGSHQRRRGGRVAAKQAAAKSFGCRFTVSVAASAGVSHPEALCPAKPLPLGSARRIP